MRLRCHTLVFASVVGALFGLLAVIMTVRLFAVEHGNVAIDVSPDEKSVVFSSADGDLYLLDLATRAVTRLTETEVEESTPAFSPDGTQVAYAAGTQGGAKSIYVLALATLASERITNDPDVSDERPTFSPDGKEIAFVRAYLLRPYSMGGWRWDNWDVCVMKSDGSAQRRITKEEYYLINTPHFDPTGQRLIFGAMKRGMKETCLTYEVDLQNAHTPQPLEQPASNERTFGAWASDATYSRDAKQIAFISDRSAPFQYDVWTCDRASGSCSALKVLSASTYNMTPVFAPDDRKLYFLAGSESNVYNRRIFSLWQVNLDGGEPERIADSGLFTDPAAWPPAAP